MKKILFIFLLLCLFSLGVAAQTKPAAAVEKISAALESDGCSMFPDGDYRDCCVVHDNAYFAGGSWTMRWRADKRLFECVAGKPGLQHKFIAPVMWLGVRVFGVSCLPTRFRWGFGRAKKLK